MKKYLVAAVVATGLLISACGGAGGASPVVTVTATQTETAQPVQTQPTTEDQDYMFLEAIRNSNITWLMQANTSDLLDLAHQACNILDSGVTLDQLIAGLAQSFVEQGMTSDPELYRGTGFLLAAAVNVYCPQYGNQI